MLAFAAAMILAATNPVIQLDAQEDASQVELVFEEMLENEINPEEIVFDDTLLSDAEADLLEFEEQ